MTTRLPRGWLVGVAIALILMIIAIVLGNVWMPRKLESFVSERLEARGLVVKMEPIKWLPIRGLMIDKLEIRQSTGERPLVCRADNISVRIPLWRAFDRDLRVTHWSVRNETVTLGDADGEITLRNVSARCEMRLGEIEVHRFRARSGGMQADLKGRVVMKTTRSEPKPFALKLRGLRGTLASLDFSDRGKPFKASGTFEVDLTDESPTWKSKLHGEGKAVVWKGVNFTKTSAAADLSSNESVIRATLELPSASTSATISKSGWKETPFVFEGTLKDKEGRQDTYQGSFVKRTLTINRLEGNADLFNVARNVPALVDHLPEGWVVARFPEILAKEIRWNAEGGWGISSLQLRSEGAVVIPLGKRKIEVTGISGAASCHDGMWRISQSRMEALGGNFRIQGDYREGTLRRSTIEADGIQFAELKRTPGKGVGKGSRGVLSFSYQGSITPKSRELHGAGIMRLDGAPVFEVPLLDEVYGLFEAIIPGAERTGEGRFDASFTSKSHVVEVKRFSATGGSLSVHANGTVDLKSETVSGFARGNLAGPPALLTKPIGKLLEMEVSGTLDKIQVTPVGPARSISKAATGTAGKIVEGLEKVGEKLRGKESDKKE